MKVATVVGTRPEIIRLSRVLTTLGLCTEHTLIHTGQNYDYELNQIFFDELDIRKPDVFLKAAGKTAAETIAQVIAKSDAALRELKPDAFLVLGDTNSCLAALSAKRLKIPVFHMEAGNRCFDQRVPEEINRKIVDHISDINMPYSTISRDYLLREGLPPDRVIKTGSPMFEVIHHYRSKIDNADILDKLSLTKDNYYVVSVHREENVDNSELFVQFITVLNNLAKENKRIIVSTHPRTRKRLEAIGMQMSPEIEFLKPFGFIDYINLQLNAKVVLSDSGTITEEASILGFPALNLREAHERPEGMEEATVMMVGMSWSRIHEGLNIVKLTGKTERATHRIVEDYNIPNVSEKVVKIILSYTDYVNRIVWKK